MDVHAAGIDAARQRVAAGVVASAVRTGPAWPRQLGGGRCALPPRPRPPLPPTRSVAEGPRRSGGDDPALYAGEAAGDTRDARRGAGPVKAEEEEAGGGSRATSRGGGVARSGVVAPVGPDADALGCNAVAAGVADALAGDGAAGVAVVVASREERGGGGVVGSKRPFASASAPRAYPPPKRRLVSATRRFPPGCGRGADDGGSRLVAAPARPGLGGSTALAKKLVAPPTPSVGEAGSSAAAVPRPIGGGGHHSQDAGALRSPEPSRHRSVAAADSQGGSGSGKRLVPAMRLLPKPTIVSAIRRFPPGCGRVSALQTPNKSADKRPLTESNQLSAAMGFSGLQKKIVKCPAHLGMTMGSMNRPDEVAASILQDDGFLGELADYERELELKFNVSSDVLSVRCQRQHAIQNVDARSKVKMMCKRFQFMCKAIEQFVEQRSLKIRRIDITADKVIKELPGFTQHGPIIGNVPGVEIGDEFMYRVELALVGLHRPYQGGIDITRVENGVLVAISIVASGGYPDELSSLGKLVYTGSGGKLAGKKDDENQKLERGNLGLKNCIETMTPVRVIYGLKRIREEGSHPRAKGSSSFTYDGLYHVVDCWIEGQAGSKVFKYDLRRIPGQPTTTAVLQQNWDHVLKT